MTITRITTTKIAITYPIVSSRQVALCKMNILVIMKPVSGPLKGTRSVMNRSGYWPKTFLIWPTLP
jgi:hypothetical protein